MHQADLSHRGWKRVLNWNLLFSYLASIALTMYFPLPTMSDRYVQTPVAEALWNLIESTRNHSALSTLLFVCLAYISTNLQTRMQKTTPVVSIVSALLAMVWLFGKGYQIDDSVYSLYASMGQVVKSAIYLVAMTWLISLCAKALFLLLHHPCTDCTAVSPSAAYQFFSAHRFCVSFVLFLICWVPHLLIAFPGNTCFDVWDQLSTYYGLLPFTSHHPPVHTLFMGSVIKFGSLLGNGEYGIFLFALIQILSAAAVMAYSIHTLSHLHAPKWLIIGSVLFFACSPYLSSYTTVLLKDNLYSYAFVLYMIELVYMLILKENFFKSVHHIGLFCLSVSLVILMRNNGKYIIYFMTAVMLMIVLVSKKAYTVRISTLLCVLLVPILLSAALNSYCEQKYDIQKGSIAEALSLPLQQTARYVKLHGDEVTEAERKAINGVIPYASLAQNYNPQISDPVKAEFYQDVAPRELINYLKVWVKQFFKHPATYFHATANQNYYLLYPGIENTTIYSDTYFPAFAQKYPLMAGFESASRIPLTQAETTDQGLFLLAFSSPVLGFFMHPAISNILLLFLFIFAACYQMWNWLLLSLPLLLSVGVILLSPVIQGHPRYAFPIIFSMPLIIGYYLFFQNQQCSK